MVGRSPLATLSSIQPVMNSPTVWRRWRSGEGVRVLAREMRRSPSTARALIQRSGGIRPAVRCRWELRLSVAEREEIYAGLRAYLDRLLPT